MKRFLLGPWLTVRVQIALGVVFVAAALPKIVDPPAFAQMIYNYHLVPGAMINVMALSLPWLELLIGLALILGIWRRTSASLAAALLVVFMIAIGINLARDNAVNCGCFSVDGAAKTHEQLIAEMWWVMLRDVGLLAMAIQILAALRARIGESSEEMLAVPAANGDVEPERIRETYATRDSHA